MFALQNLWVPGWRSAWKFGVTGRSKRSRSNQRPRRWFVETLEDRTLLTGSVTATFSQGSLLLSGDTAANDVSIQIGTVPNQVSIIGNNGTQINGPSTGTVTGSLTIDLGAGDDTVTWTGEQDWPSPHSKLNLAQLRIVTGDGADAVIVEDVRVQGSLVIDTGRGDDSVGIGNLWAGSVSVTTGDGNDQVGFGGLEGPDVPDPLLINGSFTIDTGAGRDYVGSYGKAAVSGRSWIKTGADSDIVFLGSYGNSEYSRFHALKIDSGTGDDKVTLSGIEVQSTNIQSGAGNDQVYLGGDDGPVRIHGRLTVDTGDGIYASDSTPVYFDKPLGEFDAKVTFSTGSGSDFLRLDGSSSFYGPVTAAMGAGKDTVELGRPYGGLTIDGPLLLNMGGDNDTVSIGIPGVALPGIEVMWGGSTNLNGPVTVRGGRLPTTVVWNSANSSFNGGLKLVGAKVVEQTLNQSNVVDTLRLNVTEGQTATYTDQQQQTFLTNYTVTRDATGAVSVTPVVTALETGFSLVVSAFISSDYRYVTVDVHLINKTIADPVATMAINTPVGTQTIQLPVVRTIDVRTQVTVPDGGTYLVRGIRRQSDSVTDNQPHADSSSLTMYITPRIINENEGELPTSSQVTVEVRLIEIIDRNIVPGAPDPTEGESSPF